MRVSTYVSTVDVSEDQAILLQGYLGAVDLVDLELSQLIEDHHGEDFDSSLLSEDIRLMLLSARTRIKEVEQTWRCISGENFPFDELYEYVDPILELVHQTFQQNGISLTDLQPQQDDFFVCLFVPMFPGVPREQLLRLMAAGILIRYTALALDYVFDETLTQDESNAYTQYAFLLQNSAVRLLQGLFPAESLFWDAYDEGFHLFFRANMVERTATAPLSWQEYEDLAVSKSALGELAVWGLATLTDQKVPEMLIRSMRSFVVGFQLYDDIRDIEHDVSGSPPIVPWYDQTEEYTLKQVSSSGQLFRLLTHARKYCEDAMTEAAMIGTESYLWIRQILSSITLSDGNFVTENDGDVLHSPPSFRWHLA